MKAVILGAGFGTRLERDLRAEGSGEYQHLIGVPKPLLPIGTEPLVTHWMQALNRVPTIDAVYIVTNQCNHEGFVHWAKSYPNVRLVCDGAVSNESRIGAVAAMSLCVQHFGIEDELVVIAGDTLFYEDFRLEGLLERFTAFTEVESKASVVLYVTCKDEEVHKYGILETDVSMKVIGFLEKPQLEDTASRKECPCFYILNRHILGSLQQFLIDKKDEELKSRDATGNFIAYLYTRYPVYAVEITGRFDVGNLKSYIDCHKHFLQTSSFGPDS